MTKERKMIVSFGDYYAEATKDYTTSENHVISREHWLEKFKANEGKKIENVLDKIPVDELEQAEDLSKKSAISSYIDSATIVDVYGDEYDEILKTLGDNGVLVYQWNGETTIWKTKEDGLVRIK